MTELLNSVQRIYDCAGNAYWNTHQVNHPLLERLCRKNWAFKRAVTGIDFWTPWLRLTGRFCFRALTTPLPLRDLMPDLERDLSKLDSRLSLAPAVDPNNAASGLELVDILKETAQDRSNPLLDEMIRFSSVHKPGDTALVLIVTTLLPAVRAHLASLGGPWARIKVVSPSSLKQVRTFDCIVLMGAARWFPKHVFSAPRASIMQIIRYKWIGDKVPEVDSLPDARGRAVKFPPSFTGEDDVRTIDIPELDPFVLSNPAVVKPPLSQDDSDVDHKISCRFLVLGGGYGVFLDEESRVMILDMESSSPDSRLRTVPFDLVEPGMFVILRTQGGGDLIVPIADQILGQSSQRLRGMQREWKKLLIRKARDHGISTVARTLQRLGSKVATEQNVRNWISERSISTRSKNDFFILFRYLGLFDQADSYWVAMQTIQKAHHRAGQHLRKLLLQQIEQVKRIDEIMDFGFKHFTLEGQESGKISAFRVESISQDSYEIPASRIGRLQNLEEVLWPG